MDDFQTEQMIKYKKKLKESGGKPQKSKKATPEQHFDDCGEDLRSINHVCLVPESYADSYRLDHEHHQLPGMDLHFDVSSWLGVETIPWLRRASQGAHDRSPTPEFDFAQHSVAYADNFDVYAAISRALGDICAYCALVQLACGRHFFLEQPKGSDLFKIDIY